MDATPIGNKGPPAADADAPPSAAQQAVDTPLSWPDDAVAGRTRTRGGEDDDEQVERFYALLDNIRSMRGMLGTGGGTATATAAGRKRAREAEPPWRPAFRMEDFELEEVQSAGGAPPCCDARERTKRDTICAARRPALAARRETTTDGDEQEGEVVEARGGPRGASHKARRAGVLAVDRLGSR